jgi:hypothetical protein
LTAELEVAATQNVDTMSGLVGLGWPVRLIGPLIVSDGAVVRPWHGRMTVPHESPGNGQS